MFKQILGEQWNALDPMLQEHYGINDGDSITVRGNLAVRHGNLPGRCHHLPA